MNSQIRIGAVPKHELSSNDTLPKYQDLFFDRRTISELESQPSRQQQYNKFIRVCSSILVTLAVFAGVIFGIWILATLIQQATDNFNKLHGWCNVLHTYTQNEEQPSLNEAAATVTLNPKNNHRSFIFSKAFDAQGTGSCDFFQAMDIDKNANVEKLSIRPLTSNSKVSPTKIVHDFRVNYTGVLTEYDECYIFPINPQDRRLIYTPITWLTKKYRNYLSNSHSLWNSIYIEKTLRAKYPPLNKEEILQFGPVIYDLCKEATRTLLLQNMKGERYRRNVQELYYGNNAKYIAFSGGDATLLINVKNQEQDSSNF